MRGRAFGWILFGAAILATLGARPYAGGWNDGSRLASVESLVDRHTFAIDDSIYVQPQASSISPYSAENPVASQRGTMDKLFIRGRFYSDKSPVPTVLMAGVYQAWCWLGGPSAAERPDLFARFMSWTFAGLPFLIAVLCVGRIARHLRVPSPWDWLLTASFAYGSLALPYAMQVNNHVLLLAVAAGICEATVRPGSIGGKRAAWLGLLAGLGYTIDLGAGPPLVLAIAGLLLWRTQSPLRLALFVLGALPFVTAHHAINYAISGSIGPANANPEFFRYPNSPFHAGNMTGGWNHPSLGRGVVYALELLGGKKGFLLYSPPLLAAVLAGGWLLVRRRPERATLVALAVWCLGTWLIYAATSRNMSGSCLSIRWFVPLIAPGMVVLAVVVRDMVFLRKPVLAAIGGGLVLNLELTWRGPWSASLPFSALPIIGVALAASSGMLVRTPEVRWVLASFAATILRQLPAGRMDPARLLSFRVRIPDSLRAHAARTDLETSRQLGPVNRLPTNPTVETLSD